MTWYHLVIGGMHYLIPSTSILAMYSGATDGTQTITLALIDGSEYQLTLAQATKIIGTLPGAL